MHSVRHVIGGLVLLGALSACGRTHESASVEKLSWVVHADPVADAAKTLATHDHRLLGVYGIVLTVPGIDSADQQRLVMLYGVRPLEGTSDALESPRHAELVKEARDYALHYNTYVLAHAQVP